MMRRALSLLLAFQVLLTQGLVCHCHTGPGEHPTHPNSGAPHVHVAGAGHGRGCHHHCKHKRHHTGGDEAQSPAHARQEGEQSDNFPHSHDETTMPVPEGGVLGLQPLRLSTETASFQPVLLSAAVLADAPIADRFPCLTIWPPPIVGLFDCPIFLQLRTLTI